MLLPFVGSGKESEMKKYDLVESAKRIKELRKAHGYTQEVLAEIIGISCRTYQGIESGRHSTSIETLVVLSEVLDSSLDYIVTGTEYEGEIVKKLEELPDDKKMIVMRVLKGVMENL